MHMADALLSPVVGGALWAASAGCIVYCSGKVRRELDERKAPLMGVLGAFIFAVQMINFTIPATGSSGHLSGGLLLSILLGPHAAFLAMASVLVVQALFFADGGLLALGCNIFNLGFIPAFIACPLIYRKIAGYSPTPAKMTCGALVAGVLGMQMGAFGVVLQTWGSGVSSLPLSAFALLMQPIHLPIGLVEGIVTAGVLTFVQKARPEILLGAREANTTGILSMRSILISFFALALVAGGLFSRFASGNPDGLEWSIMKTAGQELAAPADGVHGKLAALQRKLSVMPDYSFRKPEAKTDAAPVIGVAVAGAAKAAMAARPEPHGEKAGQGLATSVAGLVGGMVTLALAFVIGAVLRRFSVTQPQ